MYKPETHKLIVDISHWTPLTGAQMIRLREEFGVAAIIAKAYQMRKGYAHEKCIDSMLFPHQDAAIKAGMPFGVYMWHDPMIPWADQFEGFINVVEEIEPDSLFGDYEQYWRLWDEYWAARQSPGKYVQKIPQDHLYNETFYMRKNLMEYADGKGLAYGSYSAKWFIDGYCPRIGSLIKNDITWLAEFPVYRDPTAATVTTRDDIWTWLLDLGQRPGVPRGMTDNCGIWQFTDSIVIPGLPILDWNVITNDAYDALFSVGLQEPKPEPGPISITSWPLKCVQQDLNVRTAPRKNGAIIGTLNSGEYVGALNVVGTSAWAQIDWDGMVAYVNIQDGTDVNMVVASTPVEPALANVSIEEPDKKGEDNGEEEEEGNPVWETPGTGDKETGEFLESSEESGQDD